MNVIDMEKSRQYLHTHCRELEIARFEYWFGNGTNEKVLECLKSFQNEDGGFGHGLEPDFWLPHSSPMATWAAGQILLEMDVDKREPMVQEMLNYLVATYDREEGIWASLLQEFNDYPHAPWWHWEERVQQNWSYNPSIELAGFLIHWSEPDTAAFQIGWQTVKNGISHLMNQTEMDKHEINNFQQCMKLLKPFQSIFEEKVPYTYEDVLEKIQTLALDCVHKDVHEWKNGYVPLPLEFVDHPNDPLCEKLGTLIQQNLDFYLEQLSEIGYWDISWEWGNNYLEEFELARIHWRGILTVDRFKLLQAFGYLNFNR